MDAGHVDASAGRVHDHVLVRPDAARCRIDLLDLDHVGVGFELHVVEDAHRRHHEAHLDRERAAQRLDLLGQAVVAVRRIDQRQQRVSQFDLEIVDLERGRNRLFRRRAGGGRRLGRGLVDDDLIAGAFVDQVGECTRRRRRGTGTAAWECRAAAT